MRPVLSLATGDTPDALRRFPARSGPLLVIAPHPDDETLGAGGLLRRALSQGRDVWVVFVTSGDAFPWGPHRLRRWYGGRAAAQLRLAARRMAEARTATALLGVPPDRVVFLGFPDRGLSALAHAHTLQPYRSPATGVNFVPYLEALRPGAPYTGAEVVRQLRQVLARVRPEVLLTPGPLDSHADHRATTALVHRALAGQTALRVLYYLVHSGPAWPAPKGYHPRRSLTPPPGYGGVRWLSHALSREELRAKRGAIAAYSSQVQVMGWNLWSFLRRNELLISADALPLVSVPAGAFTARGALRR